MDAPIFQLLLFLWLIQAIFGQTDQDFCEELRSFPNRVKATDTQKEACQEYWNSLTSPTETYGKTTKESKRTSPSDREVRLVETTPSEQKSNEGNSDGTSSAPDGSKNSATEQADAVTEGTMRGSPFDDKGFSTEPSEELTSMEISATEANHGSGDQTANASNNNGNIGITENSAALQTGAGTEANQGVSDGKTNAPHDQQERGVTQNENAVTNANKGDKGQTTNAPGDLGNQGVTPVGQERAGTEEGMGGDPSKKSQNGSKKKKTGEEKGGTESQFPQWVPMAIGFVGCVLSCVIFAISTFVCSKGKERPMYMA